MNIMTQQASGDFTGQYSVSQPTSSRLTDTPMEQFLTDIERRAFHMARMATGSRDDALDIVQDAMYKLVEKYSSKTSRMSGAPCFTVSSTARSPTTIAAMGLKSRTYQPGELGNEGR